jgi:hypothetical protein
MPATIKKKPAFDLKDDYENLMQKSQKTDYQPFINQTPQWNKQGDYFVHFSLYPTVPSGKTTTETQITNQS